MLLNSAIYAIFTSNDKSLLPRLAITASFPQSFGGNPRRQNSLDTRFRGYDNFEISKLFYRRYSLVNLDMSDDK